MLRADEHKKLVSVHASLVIDQNAKEICVEHTKQTQPQLVELM